jgi:hypothetical protein
MIMKQFFNVKVQLCNQFYFMQINTNKMLKRRSKGFQAKFGTYVQMQQKINNMILLYSIA